MTASRASETTAPIVLLGISGSLRTASYNTALLRVAAGLVPDGVEVRVLLLHDVPLFDADVEKAHGYVGAVAGLRDAIREADGLLLAAPEYNHSISGVLKNAIDWASRGKPTPLDHKPAGLMSAAGGSGGANAQAHLRDVLAHNRVEVVGQPIQVVRAWEHFQDGELVTASHREAIRQLVEDVAERARERRLQAADAA